MRAALVTVECVLQYVGMVHVTALKPVMTALPIVVHAPHLFLCVAMESVMEPKRVLTVLAIVPVSAPVLTDKSAIITHA